MKIYKKGRGFTLMELMISIAIIAILAAMALPRYQGLVERSRASEAVNILGALLSAQERHNLEEGAFTNNLGDLDVTIPAPQNFGSLTVNQGCADATWCASLTRTGNHYSLTIDRDGDVVCTEGVGTINCDDAGY